MGRDGGPLCHAKERRLEMSARLASRRVQEKNEKGVSLLAQNPAGNNVESFLLIS